MNGSSLRRGVASLFICRFNELASGDLPRIAGGASGCRIFQVHTRIPVPRIVIMIMSRESRLQGRGGEINNGDSRCIRGHVNWRQSRRAGSDVKTGTWITPGILGTGEYTRAGDQRERPKFILCAEQTQRAVTVHTPHQRRRAVTAGTVITY